MQQFTDEQGVQWDVKINAYTAQRVRETCDPQFLFDDDPKQLTSLRLARDPILFCQVLYVLTEKQRKERGVETEEDFCEHLTGDTIDQALEAFIAAWLNFTRKRDREVIAAVVEKTEQMEQKARQAAIEKINDPTLEKHLLAEMQANIDREVDRVLTQSESATATPASSESTPAS